MLARLTKNDQGLNALFKAYGGEKMFKCEKDELWNKYFSALDGFGDGYYLNFDMGLPKYVPMYAYNEFTREIEAKDSLNCLEYKFCYGTADNKEQIDDYFKEEINDPNTNYVIFISKVDYEPCRKECEKGSGGYRPYKSGIYLGEYDEIRECEYYGDCKFDEDYQGYLLKFEICKVV